jgi:hypothetical protein
MKLKVMEFNGKKIYNIGACWVYAEDIVAMFAVVFIFFLGMIMVQLGREMDLEVERQHQAEMIEIANDKLVNQEVTR